MTELSQAIKAALELPNGARFYRCALQVNPFSYLKRQKRPTAFADEEAYNQAIVQACREHNVEVIAITDHYRVQSTDSLMKAAQSAGIYVFPGFEARTKDGIHFLCLFDPSRDARALERLLGDCGIHEDNKEQSPTGKYDALEFLRECAEEWRGVCISAHIASESGLLVMLSGQPRMNAWRSPHLLACSLPGPLSDAPCDLKPILENKNPDYKRERPVAILNAQDVSSPEDLARPGASCWIKMSEPSVDGLRQAFLDPGSRIRLATDPPMEEHTEFVAVAWQGGFLDGSAVHFGDNLNVLIGGRGAGKSTVIESLRYVLGLEPLGEEARKAHEGIVRQVLRSGTKISLLVCSHRPAKRRYLIERTIPNPPTVRDEGGTVLNLTPADIIEQVEVYGQHEISELTKSREKLTRLLDRFVDRDSSLPKRKNEIRLQLERSRSRVLDTGKEILQIGERLAALPALEETLRRFQDAGLEEKLKEQSLLVREERILKTAEERLEPFQEWLSQLERAIPIDRAFLSAKALEGLPGKDILSAADTVLEQLDRDVQNVITQMMDAIARANTGINVTHKQWEDRKKAVLASYETILRDLQKSKVDGEEFIRLRRQIEDLRPLKERLAALERDLKEYLGERRNLISEWEDIKGEEFRQLERASKKVNRRLEGRVSAEVTAAGNREPLAQLLRDQIGGRLSEAIEILKQKPDFSLPAFAAACGEGRDALSRKFGISPGQADRIAGAHPEVVMQIEELDLPSTTTIKLNVAAEDQPVQWQTLEELSTGQKATAVLLLLLLESQAPLIVDQPEDDLDNRFISDGVVPKIREEKRRRQFLFATHNANIPVLGDAELIVGLSASGEASQGKARLPQEHMGSIDSRIVRELVEEVLEGGRDAFEMRRLKYGF